jgi:hypothetical protein
VAGRIKSMKNSNEAIGNRTRSASTICPTACPVHRHVMSPYSSGLRMEQQAPSKCWELCVADCDVIVLSVTKVCFTSYILGFEFRKLIACLASPVGREAVL